MQRSHVTSPAGVRIEYRHERGHVNLLNQRTGDVHAIDAVSVQWRRRGDYYWRRKVLVANLESGQTMRDVLDQLDLIVLKLDEEHGQ